MGEDGPCRGRARGRDVLQVVAGACMMGAADAERISAGGAPGPASRRAAWATRGACPPDSAWWSASAKASAPPSAISSGRRMRQLGDEVLRAIRSSVAAADNPIDSRGRASRSRAGPGGSGLAPGQRRGRRWTMAWSRSTRESRAARLLPSTTWRALAQGLDSPPPATGAGGDSRGRAWSDDGGTSPTPARASASVGGRVHSSSSRSAAYTPRPLSSAGEGLAALRSGWPAGTSSSAPRRGVRVRWWGVIDQPLGAPACWASRAGDAGAGSRSPMHCATRHSLGERPARTRRVAVTAGPATSRRLHSSCRPG